MLSLCCLFCRSIVLLSTRGDVAIPHNLSEALMSLGTAKPPYLQSNGWWKFRIFLWPTLVCVFVFAWWVSPRVCEKDVVGEGCLPVCTGVGCCISALFEGGAGRESAGGAEDLSHCLEGYFVKPVVSREVNSSSLCLWITEKEHQAFFSKPVFVPQPVKLFINNVLCQANISCSNKICRLRWEAVGILRDDHFIATWGSCCPFRALAQVPTWESRVYNYW